MVEALKSIHLQIMWNRLLAVVEEQAQALKRTAFGSVVRETGDLSAGVYDVEGNMLAQAVTGTPGHVNTMATAVRHFMVKFPAESMRPGDVYVTNDPWLGTGHLFDFVVVTPVFRDSELVGIFASTCHTIDVGGLGFSADARSVLEEGVLIPHMKLRDGGRLNEDLFAICMANSRNPVELRGDVLSLVSANDVGVSRLTAMMAEFGLASIQPLAAHILETSRRATLEAIQALPLERHDCSYTMKLDGYDEPIELKARLIVGNDGISVDYAGSSPAIDRGINSPLCYSEAYSVFGLKCIVAPDIPNNAGSLSAFRVTAPEDSIVNPTRPRPVTARHAVGQMLPDVMFGCLAQALGNRVPAEGAGSLWVLAFSNAGKDRRYNVMGLGIGGAGARPGKDGLSTTAFPSGVATIPVEVTESECPLVYWHKEYSPDSGGPGQFRGGLGQQIRVGHVECGAFKMFASTFERRQHAAQGRAGGLPGAPGNVRLAGGTQFDSKSEVIVPAGETLVIDLPGGGGFGDVAKRNPEALARDVADGRVSAGAAAAIYGAASTKET